MVLKRWFALEADGFWRMISALFSALVRWIVMCVEAGKEVDTAVCSLRYRAVLLHGCVVRCFREHEAFCIGYLV